METKKISVALNSTLEFPSEIVTHRYGEDFVLVSPKDGNWLVVSETQFLAFEQLRLGRTIGEVFSTAVDKRTVMSLLKQIFARNFIDKDLSVSDYNKTSLFYLTYDCNLQCEHCYMYGQRREATILTVPEYEGVFEGLWQNGIKEVTFSGGEPLMRSDFWGIIRSACKIGMIPKILSNGTLWTDSDAEKAKDFAIKVQISIDGVDEESCSKVRGIGVFEKAKDTAIRLAEAGVDVEIATTPTLANIEAVKRGYSDFVMGIREKVGQRIKFKVSLDLMPGRNVAKMTLQEKQEFIQIGSALYEIANPEGVKNYFADDYRKGKGRISCGLGRLAFSPDGFVHVCSQLSFLPAIGNVRDVSIVFLLKKARKLMMATSIDNTIPCQECSLRYMCGGGCRMEHYEFVSNSTETPSIHKPCSDEHKLALVKMMALATKECYRWD